MTDGDIAERFRRAGLRDVVAGSLEARADYADFADFWEPFTFALAPAGQYLASLDAGRQAQVRDTLRAAVPDGGPFSLAAGARYARGTAP